jgi:hypothetical protein
MLVSRTSANLIQFSVTTGVQQLCGLNPNRIGLILPIPANPNSYQLSFAKGMTATVMWLMASGGFNEVWDIQRFGTLLQLPIWILGNGSFTAEFTELICEPGELETYAQAIKQIQAS